MEPQTILDYWFKEIPPENWFKSSDSFDDELRARFTEIHQQAAQGELASWRETIHGRLAEIIILDQFSRNIYRGSTAAFSCDNMALALAQEAIKQPDLNDLSITEKGFLFMPYMHSESLLIHQEALRLFSEPGLENQLHFEQLHLDIIEKFGRYPHRNQILGRISTPEEIAFLKEPNSSF